MPLFPRYSSIGILCAVAALTALAALHGCGSDAPKTDDGDSGPPLPHFGLGTPENFVPLATPLPSTASEAEKHFQLAELAKKDDPSLTLIPWCNPAPSPHPSLQDRSVVPITELFDGLYYTGMVAWGQHVIKISDGGYILIDTLGSTSEVETITIPQLAKAGIDPARLRAILITHEHADHDGGTAALIERYGNVPIFMGSAGYSDRKPYKAANLIDSTKLTPQHINVGGVPIIALPTPGHTPGTTSFIIPATYKGKPYNVALWGGLAMPGGITAPEQYMKSAESFYQLLVREEAHGSLNNHTFGNGQQAKIDLIRANGGISKDNPMLSDPEEVRLYFASMRSCAAAVLGLRDGEKRNPVWHPTKVNFYAGKYLSKQNGVAVAAQVSNYFSVLADAAVQFTANNGQSCTAVTDRNGIASCLIEQLGSGATVTARFAGSTTPNAVELPSARALSIE